MWLCEEIGPKKDDRCDSTLVIYNELFYRHLLAQLWVGVSCDPTSREGKNGVIVRYFSQNHVVSDTNVYSYTIPSYCIFLFRLFVMKCVIYLRVIYSWRYSPVDRN